MPGEFEKEVQHGMQDFRISPGPQVWKQVEAALPVDKRKRRFIYWWLLPLGLLVAGGTWYTLNNKKNNVPGAKELAGNEMPGSDSLKEASFSKAAAENKTPAQQQLNPVKAEVNDKPAAPAAANVEVNNKPQQLNPGKVKVNDKPVELARLKVEDNSKHGQMTTTKVELSKPLKMVTDKMEVNDTEGLPAQTKAEVKFGPVQLIPKATVRSNDNTGNEYGAPYPKVSKDQQNIFSTKTRPDSLINKEPGKTAGLNLKDIEENRVVTNPFADTLTPAINSVVDSMATPAIPANQATPPSKQNDKIKKVDWKFFVSAGISNTNDKLFGNQNKSRRDVQANYSGPGTALNANFNFTKPTPGFSYTVGTERLQSISKHWQWYMALQYSFLSNHQKTGARKDSAITVADYNGFNNSNSRNNSTVPGFYYSGSSISHTNTVHQLGLQTGLQYTFNPSAKKPFLLRGGVIMNQQFATNQLLYDANRNAYYYSPDATRHFTLGTQLGFDWRIGKRFSIGAFFQYNLTKINKVEMGSYLRWQMSGVRVAIPLGKQ